VGDFNGKGRSTHAVATTAAVMHNSTHQRMIFFSNASFQSKTHR